MFASRVVIPIPSMTLHSLLPPTQRNTLPHNVRRLFQLPFAAFSPAPAGFQGFPNASSASSTAACASVLSNRRAIMLARI